MKHPLEPSSVLGSSVTTTPVTVFVLALPHPAMARRAAAPPITRAAVFVHFAIGAKGVSALRGFQRGLVSSNTIVIVTTRQRTLPNEDCLTCGGKACVKVTVTENSAEEQTFWTTVLVDRVCSHGCPAQVG